MTTLLELIYPNLQQIPLIHLYHLTCEPVKPILLHYHLEDGQQILQNRQHNGFRAVLVEDFI